MEQLTEFRVLMFDCYGTLIDWERGILNELQPWAEKHGLRRTQDELLEAFGETEAQCETETPQLLYPDILEHVLERLAARWSVTLGAGEARAFGQSVGRWPAFPDSAAALNYLQRYYKLVILSNVDHASFVRSQARLEVTFDLVITAQDVGSYKPSLKNFEYALAAIDRAFNARKPQILHTAQSIFHDVVPARKVGLKTMWINRRRGLGGWGATPPPQIQGEAARPDFEVGSLAELTALHKRQLRAVQSPLGD